MPGCEANALGPVLATTFEYPQNRKALVRQGLLDLAMMESGLLEAGRDRRELSVEGAAEAVYNCDDRERNAGGNQAVFDRGCAGLVLYETCNKVLHFGELLSVHELLTKVGLTGPSAP